MPLPLPALQALQTHSLQTRIAVVGASNDPAKYGHIITQRLVRHGYTVLPVHPTEATIAGLPAFAQVGDIPGHVDIVNFVVPPGVGARVLETLDPAQVTTVWFQPGSFDASLVSAAEARFAHVVAGDCIMVVAGWA